MLTLISEPIDWPVSLEDLKEHLVIEHNNDDNRLELLLDVATSFVEAETGRALYQQTWKLTLPAFPSGALYLPKPPLYDIESVEYYDEDNALQTYSDYYLMTPSNGQGWIEPITTYPGTYTRPDAVQVTFTCGYETMPPQAVHAIKMLCAHWNENREALIVGTISAEAALAVKALCLQLNPGIYQ